MKQETHVEYAARRALVERQLRNDPESNYEFELDQEIREELSSGFDKFCRTAEYLMDKQKDKLLCMKEGREFYNADYQGEQLEIYHEVHRDDTEEMLREPYEKSFQQRVDAAMV